MTFSLSDLLNPTSARAHSGPVIGAHRGASRAAPENTLAAFELALDHGAELLELDVHLTRDERLAVIHDDDLSRVSGTRGRVADMTMTQLCQIDVGRRRGAQWAGQRIPELGDVFARARGRAWVNVEVKSGPSALARLQGLLREFDMGGEVIVSSFDPETVRLAAALRPQPLTGLLSEHAGPDPVAAVRGVDATLLHLEYQRIEEPLVQSLHDAGIGVVAWTVNVADEMRRLAGVGVDAVLSDDPLLLRQTLA